MGGWEKEGEVAAIPIIAEQNTPTSVGFTSECTARRGNAERRALGALPPSGPGATLRVKNTREDRPSPARRQDA